MHFKKSHRENKLRKIDKKTVEALKSLTKLELASSIVIKPRRQETPLQTDGEVQKFHLCLTLVREVLTKS